MTNPQYSTGYNSSTQHCKHHIVHHNNISILVFSIIMQLLKSLKYAVTFIDFQLDLGFLQTIKLSSCDNNSITSSTKSTMDNGNTIGRLSIPQEWLTTELDHHNTSGATPMDAATDFQITPCEYK